jgi:glycosyltransferase involved in cell wall biosynthesis
MSRLREEAVGLDGFNLALARGTGVATYARTLSFALKGLGRSVDVLYGLDVPEGAGPSLRETLFFAALGEGRSGAEAPERVTAKGAIKRLMLSPRPRDMVEVPITGHVIARALADRLPAYDRIFSFPRLFYVAARHFRRYGRFMTVRVPDPPAIMHWTYPLPLRLAGARNLYTLHDLVPLRLPFTSLEDRGYYDRLIRTCLATADHICTVSETSRRDILDLFDVDPSHVTNTYQSVVPAGPIEALGDDGAERRLRSLFDLAAGGYLLYFGAIEPKKNLGRLIEAYLETPLVVVGPRAWKAEQELRLLEGGHGVRLEGAGRIRLIDHLPRAHLMTLVRGAKAVLFPSLYEGFGLPVLEAMGLGVPVMASTGGALPEIAGDAALMVDPYDLGAMSEALRRLDADAALRGRLGRAGQARAQAFSMAAYQARLSALHGRVLDARTRSAAVAPARSFPQSLLARS